MLRAVVSEQQDDWDDHLPAALSAYRSTPHSSTGLSPYRMVYGVEMTMVRSASNGLTSTALSSMWNG